MTQKTTGSRPRGERAGYIYAFILLAVFTAAEVGLYYLPGLPDTIKIGLWVFLAAAKVALVLLFFMHLKSDRRIFDIPVALGVVLVIPLLLIVSLTAPQVVEAQGAGGGAGSDSSSGASASSGASSGAAAGASAGPTSIDVTETSFKISLSTDTMPAGKVTFHVANQAEAIPHQLVVIKTDQPADQLPTSNGKVDTSNLNVVGSTDNIQTGKNQDLTLDLSAGKYVLICNLPSHYQNGMYTAFTVTGQQGQGQQNQGQQNQGQQNQGQQNQGQQNQGQQNQGQQNQGQQGQQAQGNAGPQSQPGQTQEGQQNQNQPAQNQQGQGQQSQSQPAEGSQPQASSAQANGSSPLLVIMAGTTQADQSPPLTITITSGKVAFTYDLHDNTNAEKIQLTVQLLNGGDQAPQPQQDQQTHGEQGQSAQSPQDKQAQQSQRPGSQSASSAQVGSANSINVIESSYQITLSADSVNAGKTTFHITNQAQDAPHQFAVIKTDQAAGQLPTSNGQVDTTNLNVVADTDNIAPGASQDLMVDLTPGSYVLICNLPGHYQQGMYASFTVQGQ